MSLYCRGAPRISPGPAQLTIFYAGSVSVYDNISPEKVKNTLIKPYDSQIFTNFGVIIFLLELIFIKNLFLFDISGSSYNVTCWKCTCCSCPDNSQC